MIEQPEDVAQRTEAEQPIEVAAHPVASAIAQLSHLTLAIQTYMPLESASDITQLPLQLVSNYNNIGTDKKHGGTEIQDIIKSAYITECFKPVVAFPGLLVPLRFNNNVKFQHCLDIFDAAATDGKCEILGKPGLDKTNLKFTQCYCKCLYVSVIYIVGKCGKGKK